MSLELEQLTHAKSIRCPHCDGDVRVEAGWTALETLWLHEYECEAVLLLVPAVEPI